MDLSSGVKPSGTGWYCVTSPSATLPASVLSTCVALRGWMLPRPESYSQVLPPMDSVSCVMALGCAGARVGAANEGSSPID